MPSVDLFEYAFGHFAMKIYGKYNDTDPPDKILRLHQSGTCLIASTAAVVIHPTAKIQLTQIIYCGRRVGQYGNHGGY